MNLRHAAALTLAFWYLVVPNYVGIPMAGATRCL